MTGLDLLLLAGILAMVLLAARHVAKAKKSGAGCIGCPAAGSCPAHRQAQGGQDMPACSGCRGQGK